MYCENLLAIWEAEPSSDGVTVVLPDGCRDLIIRAVSGRKPEGFVSALYDQANSVPVQAGTSLIGFRLQPGVHIDETELLASIPEDVNTIDDIVSKLDDFTHRRQSVAEALDCLASGVESVGQAARQTGVSPRTLQRLLIQETKRPPLYWLALARIRRAARMLHEPMPLADIADICGYADQSHMTRECNRWFAVSPSVLRNKPDLLLQLDSAGYA